MYKRQVVPRKKTNLGLKLVGVSRVLGNYQQRTVQLLRKFGGGHCTTGTDQLARAGFISGCRNYDGRGKEGCFMHVVVESLSAQGTRLLQKKARTVAGPGLFVSLCSAEFWA